VGYSELTIAKPVYAFMTMSEEATERMDSSIPREVIVAYRPIRVRLPSVLTAETDWSWGRKQNSKNDSGDGSLSGGNSIVHYELLKRQGTVFDQRFTTGAVPSSLHESSVGYIRLTRFSHASTAGFINAVNELEKDGASSFILDLRNNYGGIIQEAMLTASTLLRDPHTVLCYTMNSRGGFTPHTVEDYVVDKRYPGYMLSREPVKATFNQVKRENPDMFGLRGVNWNPPSSYGSLHEQGLKRGSHRFSMAGSSAKLWYLSLSPEDQSLKRQFEAQAKIVLLINEGTASSAEVFASALHDNGRTVALVGIKTFGKGLIQHTFPMPDGGGLRLTVAEYLTPSLRHVTRVGGAGFDRSTGEWRGGGLDPDIQCESRQGIARNIGADLCVGMALDALE
jgi:hypothetical protein